MPKLKQIIDKQSVSRRSSDIPLPVVSSLLFRNLPHNQISDAETNANHPIIFNSNVITFLKL
ncbi:MAG: hypothetical protein RLY85_578 [Bacteroidota bacterium]|jgi:hypothetical protein